MPRNLAHAWQTADRTHLRCTIAVLALGILVLVAAAAMPPDWAGAIENRESQGKNPRVEDFAKTWSWIAATSNGWILTLAGLTGIAIVLKFGKIHWLSGNGALENSTQSGTLGISHRWALGAFAILLVALWVRWPRMDLSLYYDEGYSLLRYIEGDFKGESSAGPENSLPAFQRVSWTDTFFGNRHGNNNVLQSILSRVCNDTWKSWSGAPDGVVNEWALRLPSLIFGLTSIGLLGRLLLSVAPVWVSWLGMAWAAVHPWHVRYSTEARGYGIAFAFMLGAIGALTRAIETNRLRWWITFLLCQVGYMYAFPGAASFALALSAAAALWLVAQKFRGENFAFCRSRFLALVLANAGSVLIFWQLMAPCIPQLKQAVATFWSMGGGPEDGWWTDLPFYLVYGGPWIASYSNQFARFAIESGPPLFRFLLIGGVLGVAFIAGIGWWSRRKELVVWLTGGALLAAPIAYGISSLTDSILQRWYVVYLVSSVIFLFALGCHRLVNRWKTPGICLVAVSVAILAVGSAFPSFINRTTSKEQLKDVVMAVRGEVFPFKDETDLPILAAVWSWSTRLYDPYLRIIESEADLDRWIAEAKQSGRKLAVTVGELKKARENQPAVIRRLKSSGEFDHTETFYGLEDEKFAQELYWWKGP